MLERRHISTSRYNAYCTCIYLIALFGVQLGRFVPPMCISARKLVCTTCCFGTYCVYAGQSELPCIYCMGNTLCVGRCIPPTAFVQNCALSADLPLVKRVRESGQPAHDLMFICRP